MIENGNTGMVEAKLVVNRPGERTAFRIALPSDAVLLETVTVDAVPGPAGAAVLSTQTFGKDALGRITLREDAPGDFIWQEQIHVPSPNESYRPMGLLPAAPSFFQPFRPSPRCIARQVRSKFLRGAWEDMINKATGTVEEYSVMVRIWYRKGGAK